ncbi:efflux RND transporter periplasmic adaptor subunit [Paracoccus gahaiensis]|uniref:Efflux RND transporter periplasmic adaptor subunit n=1 Tax=Paracoccus gahaiensis TaxID=1706839 RepID=A0A4U0RBC6_9RHOB|nr:efflux RND transporter periplasmic adaptor subunit [Paracoccus gahaiensis]TJZ92573.1 efflux RND transporter periplasmic adaptor subunit [Paracoccus gahaiensis]
MRAVALAALLVVACGPVAALGLPDWLDFGLHAEEPAGPPRPVVSVILADRDAEARGIPGIVEARSQVQLGFQALGRMIARPADLGDKVAQGQLLAQLSTDDLVASTRAARAALDTAEVADRTARATLERTEALAERNVASDAQLEQAQQAASAASAAVERTRSELAQAEDAEGFARMTAPFAGVISAVYEAPGAVVGAGAPVLQLSAEDTPEVVIDLPEQALRGLETGAGFTVWHRNDPDTQIPATLDRIDPIADSATRTRRLYLTLPPDAPFRLGALVRVRFGTRDAPSLSLPTEALVTTGDGSTVWRVTRDGEAAHVEQVPVEAAAPFRGRVNITSGLRTGDEIVIRGVSSLAPGQPVGRRLEP